MELALAGGALLSSGCPSFCGNANSDPCICGRPKENAVDKAACDVKMACEAKDMGWNQNFSAPACEGPDDMTVPVDQKSSSDGL